MQRASQTLQGQASWESCRHMKLDKYKGREAHLNHHADHVRAVTKVGRENDAHEAKVTLMLQQPTL